MSAKSAQFPNQVFKNRGHVVALGRQTFHLVNMVPSVSAQSAQFPNPVYMNCGHVVALGCPSFHLLNLVCLACLLKVPNFKIQYM